MKLKSGIILVAVTFMMIACGVNTQKDTGSDNETTTTKDSSIPDSLKLEAGSYTDKELGYHIIYPKDILFLQENTDNTTSKFFLPKKGKAKLAIYKDERKDESGKILNFNEAYDIDKESKDNRQISYNSQKPLYYVISGVEGNEIFYQKTIARDNSLITAKLTYTKEEKPTYDSMIASLFESFN